MTITIRVSERTCTLNYRVRVSRCCFSRCRYRLLEQSLFPWRSTDRSEHVVGVSTWPTHERSEDRRGEARRERTRRSRRRARRRGRKEFPARSHRFLIFTYAKESSSCKWIKCAERFLDRSSIPLSPAPSRFVSACRKVSDSHSLYRAPEAARIPLRFVSFSD